MNRPFRKIGPEHETHAWDVVHHVDTNVVIGFAIHALMNKGLSVKTGQTHMQKYMAGLLQTIEQGLIDPSYISSHRLELEDAPQGYDMFNAKNDKCTKVIITPRKSGWAA